MPFKVKKAIRKFAKRVTDFGRSLTTCFRLKRSESPANEDQDCYIPIPELPEVTTPPIILEPEDAPLTECPDSAPTITIFKPEDAPLSECPDSDTVVVCCNSLFPIKEVELNNEPVLPEGPDSVVNTCSAIQLITKDQPEFPIEYTSILDQTDYHYEETELPFSTTKWFFDVTFNVDEVIIEKIKFHAETSLEELYAGRHVVMVPYQEKLAKLLDPIEFPPGPASIALKKMKLLGFNVTSGNLNIIPGQPIILLFDTVTHRFGVFERIKTELLGRYESTYLDSICTEERYFEYLVSLFFAAWDQECLNIALTTGNRLGKNIRKYLKRGHHEYPAEEDCYYQFKFNFGSQNEDPVDAFNPPGAEFADTYFATENYDHSAQQNAYYNPNADIWDIPTEPNFNFNYDFENPAMTKDDYYADVMNDFYSNGVNLDDDFYDDFNRNGVNMD